MSKELREIITGYGGDPDDWEFDERSGTANCEGECADGVPDWELSENYGFTVRREIGWYVQQGDADSVEEAVRLMCAMDAAHKALEDSMNRAPCATEGE